MTVGERDGPAAARLAVAMLTRAGLSSFPRIHGYPVDHAWRMSADVAAALRSLHSTNTDAELPMVDQELFGYPVLVEDAGPEWTLELIRVGE